MTPFSDRLKALRKERKMNQTELAKELGVTQHVVSAYENGREPNFDLLVKIAEYFNTTTDYLLGISPLRDKEIGASLFGLFNEHELLKIQRSVFTTTEKTTNNHLSARLIETLEIDAEDQVSDQEEFNALLDGTAFLISVLRGFLKSNVSYFKVEAVHNAAFVLSSYRILNDIVPFITDNEEEVDAYISAYKSLDSSMESLRRVLGLIEIILKTKEKHFEEGDEPSPEA